MKFTYVLLGLYAALSLFAGIAAGNLIATLAFLLIGYIVYTLDTMRGSLRGKASYLNIAASVLFVLLLGELHAPFILGLGMVALLFTLTFAPAIESRMARPSNT